MATARGVEIDGLRETVRTLERFGVAVTDLKQAFRQAGDLVTDQAVRLAPRRTGALAATIRPSNTKNKSVVRAGGRLPYAGVIHYGWPGHNIEPQPFLTDAATDKQHEVVQAVDTNLSALIRRYGLNT